MGVQRGSLASSLGGVVGGGGLLRQTQPGFMELLVISNNFMAVALVNNVCYSSIKSRVVQKLPFFPHWCMHSFIHQCHNTALFKEFDRWMFLQMFLEHPEGVTDLWGRYIGPLNLLEDAGCQGDTCSGCYYIGIHEDGDHHCGGSTKRTGHIVLSAQLLTFRGVEIVTSL